MSDESVKPSTEPAQQLPKTIEATGIPQNENAPETNQIPAPESRPSNKPTTDNKKEKLTGWEIFDRAVRVIECIAFLGAVATAIFIGKQWKEMRVASGDAEKTIELNGRQLDAMKGQSYILTGQWQAMQKQSDVMQGQLNEMKQARIDEQRAWVYVTIPNNAFDISTNNGVVNLSEKNVGKTPALITAEFGNMTENPSSDIKPTDPIGTKDSLVLIPNAEATLGIIIPLNVEARILTGIKVYVYGTIRYSDISGNNHWSQFCFSFQNNGVVMHTENFHNSCDDLEAKQNQ